MTIPDYPDFLTPQAHATAISITGAPLLILSGTLLTSQTFTLTGGQLQSTAALPIMQLGYEIRLACSVGSTATVPFVEVTLIWSDTVTGTVIAQETWMLPCGSAANYVTTGTGPTKGSSLTVKLTNQDPAVTATIGVLMLTNSRIYQRDRWIANTTANVPTYINPGGDSRREILAVIDGLSVGAGSQASRLIPPYHGDVAIYAEQVGVTAANSTVKMQVAPTSVLGTGDLYSTAPAGGAGSGITTRTPLPRAATLLTMVNAGAVAAVFTIKIIMLDDKY